MKTPARHTGALAAAALVAAAGVAQGNNDGRQSGRFASGCVSGTSCHVAVPGAMVAITGPMTLAAGARGTYTLTVASSLATFMAAGFDISLAGTAGATLATVSPGTQLRNGDITHMGRLPRMGDNVQVQFALVAPPTGGTVTLQAVGNAVNGDTRVSGDAWARATLAVTVTGDAAVTDAAVTDAAVTDAALEQYDPSASMAYGGCAATPRGGGAGRWLAGIAALTLAARRRRSCARS